MWYQTCSIFRCNEIRIVYIHTEYTTVAFDRAEVFLRIQDDARKITNNIFNLKFVQNETVGSEMSAAQFETFVIDESGRIISSIMDVDASKSGDDLLHKVTYTLSS